MSSGAILSVLAASVYDTKPVTLLTTVHDKAAMRPMKREVYCVAEAKKMLLEYDRLWIIYDYNHFMNKVDIADQLRMQYRPDHFMRNQKWWFAIFLWALGTAATNAYLVYKAVCAYEGLPEKKWMTHRQFLEELTDQLCHPELRRTDKEGKPVNGKTPEKASAPAAAAGARAASPSTFDRKEGDEGKRGSNAVSVMNENTITRARATFTWDRHHPEDPPEGKIRCQWCRHTHQRAEGHKVGCQCPECRAPQTTARIICSGCGFAFCSMGCFTACHACSNI